jgi:alkanesulfonate monooxygenase SsuD/methylene tetrahydromethanopterin reductase-like flavin-dependent oxidoreductase (luciferase family)
VIRLGYGTYLPGTPSGGAELRQEIALAESAGFDAMFFAEHHGVPGYPPDPLSLAIFALGQTSRLRAGPMPLLLPLREPARIAETAAMADFISNGRLILGVGVGYLQKDYDQIGIPFDDRGPRMEEALAVMRSSWGATTVNHRGRFFVCDQPDPLQHRHQGRQPTLWIASSTNVGIRRAARWGDGVMIPSTVSGAEVAASVQHYKSACAKAGAPVGTTAVMRRGWLKSGATADQFISNFISEFENSPNYASHAGRPWVKGLHDPSGPFLGDVLFVGEPEEIAESLVVWAARVGVDYVILKLNWGRRDFVQIAEQLTRAGTLCRRVGGEN